MILPTNEEILACQHGNKTCDDNSRRIRTAQFKKLVKWLKANNHGSDTILMLNEERWKELREAITT